MQIGVTELDLSNLLDVRDELLRLTGKTSDYTNYISNIDRQLESEGRLYEIDEVFKIGFRSFKRVSKMTASKLDEAELKELIKDEDHFQECFKFEPKIKTQEELKILLATLGYNINLKQLYHKTAKPGEFEIKETN
jgi:ribosomal protein L15